MIQCGSHSYEAFINHKGESYYVRIDLPNYPQYDRAVLHASWNLKLILTSVIKDDSWLSKIKTNEEFLDFLKTALADDCHHKKPRSHKFYKSVFQELNAIGLDATINEEFSLVKIMHVDVCGRRHVINVRLPENYPLEDAIIESHALPINIQNFDAPSFENVKTLCQINDQFQKLIDRFQHFWNSMEILDMSCCILEPLEPVFSDVTRRVQITHSCSALLIFNPYNAGQCPNFEFRGAPSDVLFFRSLLGNNLLEDLWEEDVDIHLNIISMLELEGLPPKEYNPEGRDVLLRAGECGICFEDRLDGESADQRCENDKCNSQYHQVCLLKYLSTNVNSVRIMLNAVRGPCPTCRQTIGCIDLLEFNDDDP